jgi:hypothetical protein
MGLNLDRLIAGDTFDRLIEVAGYEANEGWTLNYRLVPKTGTGDPIEFSGSAEGTAHRVTVDADDTADWTAGDYSWVSWVSKTGLSHTVATGMATVIADPRTVTAPLDMRTAARRALDDAEAALASWTPTTRRYTIGGRSMEFNSTAEIIPLISYWKAKVQREDRAAALAAGRPDPRKVFVRLGRA